MNNINILAGLFYEHWALGQDVVFIIALVVLALLFFSIITFLILNNARMETSGRRTAKRIKWYEKQIELERLALEAEEEAVKLELEQSRRELDEKRKEAEQAEKQANETRKKMSETEEELRKLFEQNEMTKSELAKYRKREGTYVPEDVVVNILTEKVISESIFVMDEVYAKSCKVPKSVARIYGSQEIAEYISGKPGVEMFSAVGKKPARYKINGKLFAFVYFLDNDKIRISFKCGPDYGSKLAYFFPGIVSKAKFPYDLIWYSVTNESKPCRLELIKLLLDISYRIAKLGY